MKILKSPESELENSTNSYGYHNNSTINENNIHEKIENLIAKHYENNFFGSSDTKRIDDYILHENYIKTYNDEKRFAFNYSFFSLLALLKHIEFFEDFIIKEYYDKENSLTTFNNTDKNNDAADYNCSNSKIMTFKFQEPIKIFKGKKNDIVLTLINNHINSIIDVINLSSIVNTEVEQKLCFSLFIIKKIVKDYSFYFTGKDLNFIFNKMKHLKE